jgi:Flp pilus assembly protein TadD
MGMTPEEVKLAEERERGREREARARLPLWALAALLAVATAGVYAVAVRNGFVDFDDRDYVMDNAHVKAGLSWQNLGWAFRSIEAANWHPVTWISHMADCQVFGLNPAGHHAVSVLLHTVNVVLLFLLLNKATGFRWRSFLVAALFALHPLNVETVAWVSERKSLLSMMFSLLAVGCYGWYVRAPQLGRYLAVVVCFALALLAKPMAVTLPIVLLILDYWPLERMSLPFSGADGRTTGDSGASQVWKKLWPLVSEKIPLLLMSLASSWVTVVAQKRGHAMSSEAALPLAVRLGNAIVSYAKYLGKTFWPNGLSYYYPHPGNRIAAWQVLAASALLIVISGLVWKRRERRHLVFGWKLYVVTLLPVIGIVQVGLQAMADRYAYIPLIGVFTVVVWELSEAAEKWRVPVAVRTSAALLIGVVLSAVTVVNIGYWRDSVTLFSHARAVIPFANSRIETNLAAALLDLGRRAEAMEHFRVAESLAPDAFIPHFNIGYALVDAGDNAGALPELQAAVRTASTPKEKSRALNRLAVAELDLGKNEEAAASFSDLLLIQPNSLAGHAGRGQALFNLARYEAARADFISAAELEPAAELILMIGRSLEGTGRFAEAAAEYRSALKANPGSAEARERLDAVEKRMEKSGTITPER